MPDMTRAEYLAGRLCLAESEALDILSKLDAYDPLREALRGMEAEVWPERVEAEKERT